MMLDLPNTVRFSGGSLVSSCDDHTETRTRLTEIPSAQVPLISDTESRITKTGFKDICANRVHLILSTGG